MMSWMNVLPYCLESEQVQLHDSSSMTMMMGCHHALEECGIHQERLPVNLANQ